MTASIWKRAACRVLQAGMKIGNYFLPFRIPERLTGAGCVKQLPDLILKKGISRVLLVTDNGLMKIGLPNGLIRAMEEAGLQYTLFSDIQQNPTNENVEAGLAKYKEGNCQAIVAFGGGSPMDCAKGIACRLAHPHHSIAQLQGLITIHKRIVPIFAIPTTSGTGSETTVAAVLTVAKTHHKASINDPVIMPHYAVLDPELTVGLPPFITATTGMDALCHAVESYTNMTYCTKLEKDFSKKAVRLIYDNLYRAYRDGSDLEARQNMQMAAFYAGRSFTRGCVGNIHGIGHTLGGLYGVPHGLAMSVIQPYALRQYGPAVDHRLADLADACGMEGANDHEKAERFIAWIEEMNRKMEIPKGFDVIRDEDIEQIITWADKEVNPLYPVPVIFSREDFRQLIESIRL